MMGTGIAGISVWCAISDDSASFKYHICEASFFFGKKGNFVFVFVFFVCIGGLGRPEVSRTRSVA